MEHDLQPIKRPPIEVCAMKIYLANYILLELTATSTKKVVLVEITFTCASVSHCAKFLSQLLRELFGLPGYNCNSGKKEHKLKLLGLDIFGGGVGVFHVMEWRPKSSVCPSKFRETKLLTGYRRIFGGISRGCPKSLRKKKFVLNLRTLY